MLPAISVGLLFYVGRASSENFCAYNLRGSYFGAHRRHEDTGVYDVRTRQRQFNPRVLGDISQLACWVRNIAQGSAVIWQRSYKVE